MTTEPTPKPNDTARDMAIRTQALEMAIRANCGQHYDDSGKALFDEDLIVTAASKFEAFIRGKITEPFVEGISNNPNNPETRFGKTVETIKKESW